MPLNDVFRHIVTSRIAWSVVFLSAVLAARCRSNLIRTAHELLNESADNALHLAAAMLKVTSKSEIIFANRRIRYISAKCRSIFYANRDIG